jgi:hypothetical protein
LIGKTHIHTIIFNKIIFVFFNQVQALQDDKLGPRPLAL